MLGRFLLASSLLLLLQFSSTNALPTLKDFSCSKTKINTWETGQKVLCEFSVSDPVGIDYIEAILQSPSGDHQQHMYLSKKQLRSGSNLNGIWETTLDFPRHAEPGYWRINIDESEEERVKIVNTRGETRLVNEELFYGSGFQQWIRVDSPGDNKAPELLSLSCDPLVDTTLGGGTEKEVTCTAQVREDGSGIQGVNAYFAAPSVSEVNGVFFDESNIELMEENEDTGEKIYTLSKKTIIYPGTESGRWGMMAKEPFGIHLFDANGNEKIYDGIHVKTQFPNAYYDVVSDSWDQTGARISSYECSTAVIDLGGDRELSCSMVVQDDISGFNYGIVEFRSPNMDEAVYLRFDGAARTTKLENGGIYEPKLIFPEDASTGLWTVSGDGLVLYDNLGNRLIYNVDTMNALNIPTFIRVTGKPKIKTVTAAASSNVGSSPRNMMIMAFSFTVLAGLVSVSNLF